MNIRDAGPLSEASMEALRLKLGTRKAELQASLNERLVESEAVRGSVRAREIQDTKDASFLAALAEVRLAGAAREIQELRDIEAALARMRGGVYGICSDCGETIPEPRLQAYPTAKRCRPCQEIKEQEARSDAGAARR